MRKVVRFLLWAILPAVYAQPTTVTPNDIRDDRTDAYALTHATIVVDPELTVKDATLLIKEGKVVAVGDKLEIPAGYVVKDFSGRFIYPGFLDIYTQYGLPKPKKIKGFDFDSPEVVTPKKEGAYGANDGIRSYYKAATEFKVDKKEAESLRKLGFSAVMSFQRDGIARGTSALVTLGEQTGSEAMLKPQSAALYSFIKGSSPQSYPFSPMGASALLRQTFLDAKWYAQFEAKPFTDQSLIAWNQTQILPQIFEVSGWQSLLQAQRIADEFNVHYIYKTVGDEYQRIDEIKKTGASLILPLTFPEAMDVSDPLEAKNISLKDMKSWELAPSNPAVVAAHHIDFALTSFGAKKNFWKNLQKAHQYGLSETDALKALTLTPAKLLGVDKQLGQLHAGAWANFIVTSHRLFDKENTIYQNWIQGKVYEVNPFEVDLSGRYQLSWQQAGLVKSYHLEITGTGKKVKAKLVAKHSDSNDKSEKDASETASQTKSSEVAHSDTDKSTDKKKSKDIPVTLKILDDQVTLNFNLDDDKSSIRLTGWKNKGVLKGKGQLDNGDWIDWQAVPQVSSTKVEPEEKSEEPILELGKATFPFEAYGFDEMPQQQEYLIQHATVWTLEKEGNLTNTDVRVKNGKISEIGQNLKVGNAIVIDGTGQHLAPGIIDEHSHVALRAVNDVAVNSGMVRMSDVIDSEDVSIYRDLAGGVTAAQLLHGSANPIGGQSALVKMRWGSAPEEMLIKNADGFIKFALGENVKRSSNDESVRYPQTRMGVEQVYRDWFTRAQDYQKEWDAYHKLSKYKQARTAEPRRDLALDAMVEIINNKRFITSHSYVQSEINMLMHVADDFNFHVNTFTHILEGYKVADKMVKHGAGGSTFSDWWAYKWEVRYAIPYNAALMTEAGVTVAVNSDDAEMSRRLNQEAAKSIKYGGMDEQTALKMVTLNPAKLLHLDKRMGSIKVGKDADLVLWSDNPLSIYAKAMKTFVDGKLYFDRDKDAQLTNAIQTERNRLMQKLLNMPKADKASPKKPSKMKALWQCDSFSGYEYLMQNTQH